MDGDAKVTAVGRNERERWNQTRCYWKNNKNGGGGGTRICVELYCVVLHSLAFGPFGFGNKPLGQIKFEQAHTNVYKPKAD